MIKTHGSMQNILRNSNISHCFFCTGEHVQKVEELHPWKDPQS